MMIDFEKKIDNRYQQAVIFPKKILVKNFEIRVELENIFSKTVNDGVSAYPNLDSLQKNISVIFFVCENIFSES